MCVGCVVVDVADADVDMDVGLQLNQVCPLHAIYFTSLYFTLLSFLFPKKGIRQEDDS